LKALETAGKKEKHGLESLFDDVYDEIPKNLQEQWDDLKKHMEKYPDEYQPPGSH
jgi:2-oxoisovalerate dehydrogenase E1 component alpha subunit